MHELRELGLASEIVDSRAYEHALTRFRENRILMPTFAQLADPLAGGDALRATLAGVDPDAADPRNLFRVHWHNAADRSGLAQLPEHLVLPPSLTGVEAPILIALADRFPMIHSHKVLAAYGVLAPRIVTGQFDPMIQRAVWPSTGNYCRGGVAISRIMGCRGVAVLPEGMSQERFDWLARWVVEPEDVIRTPGTESNVKEIYDKCHELDADEQNIIFNQFSEFANYLVHYACTGRACSDVFERLATNGRIQRRPDQRKRELRISNFNQRAIRKLLSPPIFHDQTRRLALRRRLKYLVILDVRNLTLIRVNQVRNPFNPRFSIANNTTTYDLGEFLHCHLHALMNPRFELRINLTRCATFSSSICSSSRNES